MIGEYFRHRRLAKVCREWLQHSRLCRRMRGDIARPAAVENLLAAERRLQDAIRGKGSRTMETECASLQKAVLEVMPPRALPGVRENVEVLLVALAVAMAFRCYFLQPFKIPTGSMQPTLYGIHYKPQDGAALWDHQPLRYLQWLVFGEWYVEMRSEATGRVRGPIDQGGVLIYDIGGLVHPIPRGMAIGMKAGEEVVRGQVIARGKRISGDHLFVNRVRWNFFRPRRGEVMVFRTDDIPVLDDKKTHYIKRMCGLPGERVQIVPPLILVNGKPVDDAPMIEAIQRRAPGYAGYVLAEGVGADYLGSTSTVRRLGPREYLACGDNTRYSFDGRYWGPVPEKNLVGPAALVYWPISERLGAIR